MLAKSKFNSIETLISQALLDLDISHEEFIRILNDKDKYEKMKYNLISENEDKKQKKYKTKQYMIKKINAIKKFFFVFFFIFPIYKNVTDNNVRDNKKKLLYMRFRNSY